MVVEAFCGKDEVKGAGYIGGLHLLALFCRLLLSIFLCEIMEGEMAGSEVHGWGYTELEALVEAEFSQYANSEAQVVFILVYSDRRMLLHAVVIGIGNWTYILKFNILEVGTHHHSEVEWTQVGIRAVLHRPFLSHRLYSDDDAYPYCYKFLIHII